MGSSSAIKDSDKLSLREFRLPWVLRIAFAAGILIPVCMIIHSSDRQLQAMEKSLQQKEKARVSITGERDVLAQVAAQSAAQAMELSGEVQVIAGSKRTMEQQLKESGKWLDDERRMRSSLQDKVATLSLQMKAYQEREGGLQDIIELLEGEVVSVEKRLEKMRAQSTVTSVSANEHYGDAEGRQDAQVIALLNEIGIMNGEIETVREERDMFREELDRLAAGREEGRVALRLFRKESKGRFAGFGKENN
jgi:chromosome segregation ATPase